jgi:formylglycine-generating enzyme required for sulfatase activity
MPPATRISGSLACTTTVGSYKENGFGLSDMHGNVSEWCRDWYAWGFYQTKQGLRRNPLNKKAASARVLRGGTWFNFGGDCRSAYRRHRHESDFRSQNIGFRLAAAPLLEPSEASEEAKRRERSQT